MAASHYLYPLNPKAAQKYYFRDERGNDYPTSFEGFMDCYDGARKAAEWGLSKCASRLKPGDYVWVYFAIPTKAIMAVGKVRQTPVPKKGVARTPVWIDWDIRLTTELQRRPIPYEAFEQRVQASVTPANERTLKVLNKWLGGSRIRTTRPVSRRVTFNAVQVERRQGQPAFRQNLMLAFGNRCAVSGCATRDVLQAAHVTGVRAGGHHGVDNGILLRADLHNLFDRGLMVFDDKGRVHFDSSVTDREYRRLDDKSCPLILKNVSRKALAKHRELHGWA